MQPPRSDAAFPLTRWSVVAHLDGTDDGGRRALEELCQALDEHQVLYVSTEG
jgi:hypothetical protein